MPILCEIIVILLPLGQISIRLVIICRQQPCFKDYISDDLHINVQYWQAMSHKMRSVLATCFSASFESVTMSNSKGEQE